MRAEIWVVEGLQLFGLVGIRPFNFTFCHHLQSSLSRNDCSSIGKMPLGIKSNG